MATRAEIVATMPKELQRAQAAIELPEVQEMMQRLAQYNLAVCMPHMHTDEEDFSVLPDDMLQVEKNCVVEFAERETVSEVESVAVAWKWVDNGVISGAVCVQVCTPVHTQSGVKGHRTQHNRH